MSHPQPQWIPGFEMRAFSVSGGPTYLCDWTAFGQNYRAFRLVFENNGASDLTITPETAYEADGPAEAGDEAPAAVVLAPAASVGVPFGAEFPPLFARVAVSGNTSGKWGVLGIPRRG